MIHMAHSLHVMTFMFGMKFSFFGLARQSCSGDGNQIHTATRAFAWFRFANLRMHGAGVYYLIFAIFPIMIVIHEFFWIPNPSCFINLVTTSVVFAPIV